MGLITFTNPYSFLLIKKYKLLFLLSMNEVNIKYWFRNFQKKIFYRFSGRIRTFYRRKTDLYEKKISVALPSAVAVCPEKFGSPLLPFPFNLETSAFGLVTDLVPNRSYWFLDFGNQFRRVAPIRIFGSFFTFSWNIDQFHCFWAWFDVKFYVELKKVYFMGSKVQLEAFGAQKRNLLVMNFL
jgi:hypothetical protein